MPRSKSSPINRNKDKISKKNRAPPPLKDNIINSQTPPSLLGAAMSTVAQGFAFGTGSAFAHQGVNTLINGSTNNDNNDNNNNNSNNSNNSNNILINNICKNIFKEYQKCLESEFDKEVCKKYEVQVKQCMEIS